MDLDERIEEFRNSLPEKKREAFDSLPHDYKQTLIDPEAIKKMAQASLDAAGVMKRTPAKLPSFPAPYSLPGSFLDELDEHPVATFIQIKKEFNKEFSTWVAGCCQYLGSFIELNSGNFYVNLTQCHLNKRNIEVCAKLLYLSGVMLDDKHSMKSRAVSILWIRHPFPRIFLIWTTSQNTLNGNTSASTPNIGLKIGGNALRTSCKNFSAKKTWLKKQPCRASGSPNINPQPPQKKYSLKKSEKKKAAWAFASY